jgi:glycosyltransferase involved in cell wall biosynthesis
MRVAYFTNAYPTVSHTFIRREICGIETLGVTVSRYALRPSEIFDPEDLRERKQTRYILTAGANELFRCCMVMLWTQPLSVGRALRQAIRLGWHSERGLLRHCAYLVEAVVLAQWCREDFIQHIHAHFGTNPAAIAMLASQISGIPYSFTVHGSEEFIKAALLSLDHKLEHATFAVCVSAFGRSQLMLWSSPDQWRKITIVHCGLDKTFFERTITPLPATPRLVCVGRLDENKAQTILVAAARRLFDAGIICEIVLVGDGHMRPYVEAAIRRAGLEREVIITGWASGDRVKAEITAARALVLPSLSENMPVVIMEALASGRPVISTYVGGIPELVQPGKTGWLVPAGDEIALADAMREVLVAPVDQLASMGAAGRLEMMQHHDTIREVVKLKSLFEASVSASSSPARRFDSCS